MYWVHYRTYRRLPQFDHNDLGRRTIRAYRRNTRRYSVKADWYRRYHFERLQSRWVSIGF